MRVQPFALIGGCRSTDGWREPLEEAIAAHCSKIFACASVSPVPSYVTWFGSSGRSQAECIANGDAWLDGEEEDHDGLLEWGGCGESGAVACRDAVLAESCEAVRANPGGPTACRDACGDFSPAG